MVKVETSLGFTEYGVVLTSQWSENSVDLGGSRIIDGVSNREVYSGLKVGVEYELYANYAYALSGS